MKHKYNMNESLWYCSNPDKPVLNVFINGYMNDDTPGGVPRYLVICDTHIPDEELPILESNLYRTELEAQDAKLQMMLRQHDQLNKQLIDCETALIKQHAVVSSCAKKDYSFLLPISTVVMTSKHYDSVVVGSRGNLTLERGAVVSKLSIHSGGYCYVNSGASVCSAEVHEGRLVITGGKVGRGYMDHVSGRIEVCFSGEANHIAISAGSMSVSAGLVDCVDVSSGTLVLDSPHASARGVCVEGADAQFRLYAGTATCVDISKGYIQVATGASVQNLTVKSGGIMEHLT